MPSSTSSSEAAAAAIPVGAAFERPGFKQRLTAADRPGVAQPVPERDVPEQPWGRIYLIMLVLLLAMLAGWEGYWRNYGAEPGFRNSDGEWARQRRRIDEGEGDKTVLVGSSRVLFDMQLPVWQSITGERPIQLALEGTSPIPVLEDLAADPKFTGRLLVGVAPDLFFSGFAFRGSAIAYSRKEGPSQRSGSWLSMHLLEPYLAFYDPDFALATVVRRQPWPLRPGMPQSTRVRKLMVQPSNDRETHMWQKVETDPQYSALARSIWAENFAHAPPPMDTPAKKAKVIDEQIAKASAAINTLRARGVRVVFIRPPSAGEYYAFEQRWMPRAESWDLLLQRTGVPGIHFEDHPEMQGYLLPEWSHLSASEARRFTAAVVPLIEQGFDSQPPPKLAAAR